MLKGLLKMSMLKIISENKATGYEIIKKVNELAGEKPSTGSVYPILKSMSKKGWIIGRTINGKTFYEITDSGQKKFDCFLSFPFAPIGVHWRQHFPAM